MFKQLWSTPLLHDSMQEDVYAPFLQKILTDPHESNIINIPDGEKSLDILNDESIEVQNFKNNIVYPAFDNYLKSTLGKSISDWGAYKFKSWLIKGSNSYNVNYHNHSGSQITSVFYILVDELGSGGNVTFTDPRQNSNRGYDSSFLPWFDPLTIIPKTGDYVIFPSFLYHFVSTYGGDIRIAIAVDLFLYNGS
jgi:hypothetical protein